LCNVDEQSCARTLSRWRLKVRRHDETVGKAEFAAVSCGNAYGGEADSKGVALIAQRIVLGGDYDRRR
jgi:hypothetical protein